MRRGRYYGISRMTQSEPKKPLHIVFFDGGCLLCHRTVRWVLRKDRKKKLYFASLDSIAAEQYLPIELRKPQENSALESMVYQSPSGTFTHSRAVFEILKEIHTFWSCLRIFSLLPTPCTDTLYRFVAARRNKWFGRADQCALPDDPSFAGRLLK